MAVDACGRRPRLPRLQRDALAEREPEQKRELALRVGIARDDEIGHDPERVVGPDPGAGFGVRAPVREYGSDRPAGLYRLEEVS